MNEQEVRALVREAIERHLGRPDHIGARATGHAEGHVTRAEHSAVTPQPHPSDVLPGSEVGRRHVRDRAGGPLQSLRILPVVRALAWRNLRFSSPTSCRLPPSRRSKPSATSRSFATACCRKTSWSGASKASRRWSWLRSTRSTRRSSTPGAISRSSSNVAVGYNNLDVPYARSKGIVLTNTPDVLTEATANMAMTLILAVTRRIVEGDRLVRRGEWKGFALDFMIGSDIRDQQLGIVGLGRIGQAVAEKARHLRDEDRLSQSVGASRSPATKACRSISCSRPLTWFRCTCRCRRRRAI